MTTQTSWETVRAKIGTPPTATMSAGSPMNAIDLDSELPRTTAAPRVTSGSSHVCLELSVDGPANADHEPGDAA